MNFGLKVILYNFLFLHSYKKFQLIYFILSLFTDEGMEDCGFLKFTDDSLKGSFLQTMSTMRKHRLFCDIILNVSFFICKFKTQNPPSPKPPNFSKNFRKNF